MNFLEVTHEDGLLVATYRLFRPMRMRSLAGEEITVNTQNYTLTALERQIKIWETRGRDTSELERGRRALLLAFEELTEGVVANEEAALPGNLRAE